MSKARAIQAALWAVALLLCLPALATAGVMEEAKAAFEKRADPAQAKKAVELYQKALAANPADEQAVAGLGRSVAWLGNHVPEEERAAVFEKAIEGCKAALEKNPQSLAAHYWLGVNYSYYGRAKGIIKSLNLVEPIKEEMAFVINKQPGYEQGGAYRVLGRVYYKLPGLMGGSNSKSLKNLRLALKHGPNNGLSKVFLAETLIDEDQKAEAKKLLQEVVNGQAPKGMEPEYAEWKAAASKMLKDLE